MDRKSAEAGRIHVDTCATLHDHRIEILVPGNDPQAEGELNGEYCQDCETACKTSTSQAGRCAPASQAGRYAPQAGVTCAHGDAPQAEESHHSGTIDDAPQAEEGHGGGTTHRCVDRYGRACAHVEVSSGTRTSAQDKFAQSTS